MGAHVSVPMYHRTLPQRLRLEAARCTGCGELRFPPTARCRACLSRETQAVALSGTGVVEALTFIQRAGAPPEFVDFAERNGGYHVGIVALDEGPSITGQVDADGGVEIGTRVRVVTRRLYEEEGVVRYGFKFVPVEDG